MTDNNNFANPLDGDWYGDDRKSNDMDELDEIMRLLDEGDSLPSADGQEEEWPGQTDTDGDRAERARSRQAKSAKPVKNKKDKVKKKEPKKDAGKKEKAPKAKKKDKPKKQEEPADTFGQLPAIKGGKTKSLKEPEESTQPPEEEGKKKKGKGKKEKPPKPPKDPEKVKQNRFTAIVFLVILSLIAIGATVGGYLVTHNGITLSNVYISDIFVGNMSGEEIDAALRKRAGMSGWIRSLKSSCLRMSASVWTPASPGQS